MPIFREVDDRAPAVVVNYDIAFVDVIEAGRCSSSARVSCGRPVLRMTLMAPPPHGPKKKHFNADRPPSSARSSTCPGTATTASSRCPSARAADASDFAYAIGGPAAARTRRCCRASSTTCASRRGTASATASGASTRPPVVRVPRQAPGLPARRAGAGQLRRGAQRVPRVAHGHPRGGRRAGLRRRRRRRQLRGAVGHAAGLRRRPRRRAAEPRAVSAAADWRCADCVTQFDADDGVFTFTGKNDDGRARSAGAKFCTSPSRTTTSRTSSRCGRATSTPRRSTARPPRSSSSRATRARRPTADANGNHQFAGELRVVGARYRIEGLTEGRHATCAWPARTPPRAWARSSTRSRRRCSCAASRRRRAP